MENLDEKIEVHFEKLKESLANENINAFRTNFLDMHPYDQAEFFIEIEPSDRMLIYSYLSPEELAAMMEHIELEDIQPFFVEMDLNYASMVLGEMATDDAVDI